MVVVAAAAANDVTGMAVVVGVVDVANAVVVDGWIWRWVWLFK